MKMKPKNTENVKIIDASAIDTAQILWSLGRIGAQTPINFTQISGNRYQASIPSNLVSLLSYSFKIVDDMDGYVFGVGRTGATDVLLALSSMSSCC